MSLTIAQNRLKRLVESGIRGACKPAERISQLRRITGSLEEPALRRLEELFSGLGDKTRLKILKLIAEEEICACEVMAALELTQPTASHHLGILERAGLITSRRDGKWIFYTLANLRVGILLTKGLEIVEERH